jgi:3-methylfumaryl-CoA hydratase
LDLSAAGAEAVGRSVEISDVMDPAHAAALHAALGSEGPAPQAGDPLPPFWHWLYFWDAQKPDALGRDGHPKLGGFLPDMGLPRRMWAGGRLSFRRPVLLGAAVVESQDIAYREDPSPDAPGPAVEVAPTDEMHCRRWTANSTLLFRYSALTFNGHRIHYDLDYCREVEGYPGLVVHGPLLATLMLELAEDILPGPIASFAFRARSPVFHTEAFEVCAKPLFDGADSDRDQRPHAVGLQRLDHEHPGGGQNHGVDAGQRLTRHEDRDDRGDAGGDIGRQQQPERGDHDAPER